MADDPEIKPPESEPPTPNPTKEHQGATPILRAELQIPQTIVEEYRSGQSKQDGRERWKFRVETATLIAIVIYTAIAGYQGCQMRRATEAAKATINEMRIAQRPWLALIGNLTSTQQPRFDLLPTSNIIYVGFSYRVKNVGKSPAFKAKPMVTVWISEDTATIPKEPMNTNCLFAEAGSKDNEGNAFLPESEIVFQSGASINFPVSITSIRRVWIVGRIAYQDISGGKMRHTKFWARSTYPDDSRPVVVKQGKPLTYLPIAGFELMAMDAD